MVGGRVEKTFDSFLLSFFTLARSETITRDKHTGTKEKKIKNTNDNTAISDSFAARQLRTRAVVPDDSEKTHEPEQTCSLGGREKKENDVRSTIGFVNRQNKTTKQN